MTAEARKPTMSPSETLRQKGLVLRDTLGIGMTTPVDNRVHLDAAITWLSLAPGRDRQRRRRPDLPGPLATLGPVPPRDHRLHHSHPVSLRGAGRRRRPPRPARRMADWEIDIQLPGGGVLAGALGDSDQPTVFNTGQVIFGWCAFEEERNEAYRDAAVRASAWLCDIMDDDGCWRQFGSPMTGKSPIPTTPVRPGGPHPRDHRREALPRRRGAQLRMGADPGASNGCSTPTARRTTPSPSPTPSPTPCAVCFRDRRITPGVRISSRPPARSAMMIVARRPTASCPDVSTRTGARR